MRLVLTFLLLATLSRSVLASCGVPTLIPEDDQLSIRQEAIYTVIDKDFLGSKGVDIVTIEIPERYKDQFLDKAFITYWENDKVMVHSTLKLMKGHSFPQLSDKNNPFEHSGSKVIEFSVNKNITWEPKITFLYGDMCYSRLQLNIDFLSDFNRLSNEKYEWYEEKQNQIFKQGR